MAHLSPIRVRRTIICRRRGDRSRHGGGHGAAQCPRATVELGPPPAPAARPAPCLCLPHLRNGALTVLCGIGRNGHERRSAGWTADSTYAHFAARQAAHIRLLPPLLPRSTKYRLVSLSVLARIFGGRQCKSTWLVGLTLPCYAVWRRCAFPVANGALVAHRRYPLALGGSRVTGTTRRTSGSAPREAVRHLLRAADRVLLGRSRSGREPAARTQGVRRRVAGSCRVTHERGGGPLASQARGGGGRRSGRTRPRSGPSARWPS